MVTAVAKPLPEPDLPVALAVPRAEHGDAKAPARHWGLARGGSQSFLPKEDVVPSFR
jgi:hypothetical protein